MIPKNGVWKTAKVGVDSECRKRKKTMRRFCVAVVSVVMGMLAYTAAGASQGIWDASVGDFPRLAGETGDSGRIQRAIAAAGDGGVVWFPRGEYAIDAMLQVTNFTSLLLHKTAHLKAVKEIPFLLRYEARRPRDRAREAGEMGLYIRGGDFDGAGLANGVLVMGRHHFTLSDSTFRNGHKVGLQFGTDKDRSGCEMTVNNIYCLCTIPGLAGNIGMLTYVGDSHFTDVIVVDYTIGIRDVRWSNRYTRCHVWGGPVRKVGTNEPEYLPNSIAFDLRGTDSVLDDCYADTAMIGYNVCYDARIFNCAYFNNYNFKMDNPTVFAHEGGSLIVTGGRFSKNSPNATLYRRGKKAGRLIWHDNNLLNFKPADMKGLNDELKKNGQRESAETNHAKLAG